MSMTETTTLPMLRAAALWRNAADASAIGYVSIGST